MDKVQVSAGVALAAGLWASQSQNPDSFPFSLEHQARIIPGPERIRTSQFNRGLDLLDVTPDGSRTMLDAFRRGLSLSADKECLGTRTGTGPYIWMTYKEVWKRATNFGAGLRFHGVVPKSRVGLFSKNNSDWVIAEQACNAHSVVTVPLYDTLGLEAVQHIINQAELAVVVCDLEKLPLLEQVAGNCPSLKKVVVMNRPGAEEAMRSANLGPILKVTFAAVEALGAANPCRLTEPEPNDVATICYTSGTTGLPKGAVLSHRNIISVAAGLIKSLEGALELTTDDVHLSYLPLAHMFERNMHVMLYLHGGRIGFFRGDITLLIEDIQELRPTVFPSVPRLLNKVYDKVLAGVSESAVKTFLFNRGLAAKRGYMENGVMASNTVWDKFVFAKVRETLGGRVRLVATGAAPISSQVLEFLRAAVGCHTVEGYGQTEGAAGATLSLPGDYSAGHVGSPLACCHIKLVDVPEMKYFSKDDKGEICFRGPNVFVEYLKNPGKTKETIDEDGWVHTGDIGSWTEFGQLRIVDRKKHIFKLAQGEYIAPEKIENVYARVRVIAQVFVYGDGLESKLVAVIVPDVETFEPWCKSLGVSGTFEQLCASPKVNKAVMDEVKKISKAEGLNPLEIVAAITLHHDLFSVENGLLTPTFKSKRPQLKEFFQKDITRMYKDINSKAPKSKL